MKQIRSLFQHIKLTRNFLSLGSSRIISQQDRPPQTRQIRNQPDKVEDHRQPKNPRHQNKSDHERHRPTQHQSQRNPEQERGEPRRGDLRRPSSRRRRRRRRRRSRYGDGERRRRAEEAEEESGELVENPRLLILGYHLPTKMMTKKKDKKQISGVWFLSFDMGIFFFQR